MTTSLTRIGWRGGALVLLIFATSFDRYTFEVASLTIRPEHIAFVLVAALWLIDLTRQRRLPLLMREDALLAIYLVIAFLASLLNAPVPRESFRFFALMVFGVLLYLLTRDLAAMPGLLSVGVIGMVVSGVVQASLGILGWLAFPVGLGSGVHAYFYTLGGELNPGCNYTFAARGTLYESNIFGSYVAAASVLTLFFLLSEHFRTRRTLLLIALVILMTALGLSLSRGAWLGFGIGALAVLVWAREKQFSRRVLYVAASFALFLVVAGASILAAPTLIRLPTAPRVGLVQACDQKLAQTPVSAASDPNPVPEQAPPLPASPPLVATAERLFFAATIPQRVSVIVLALRSWALNPIIGNGANSYAQFYSPSKPPYASWISNMTFMALHDTGIGGLLLLGAWLLALTVAFLRVNGRLPRTFAALALSGLGAACISLLVAYQFTTALWLGLTWVYFGVLRAAAINVEIEQRAKLADRTVGT